MKKEATKSTLKKAGKSFFGASALARIHTCAHFWYLQCFGDAELISEPDAGALKYIDAGISFEKEIIQKLKVVQPEYNSEKPWEGIEPTLELMKKGTELIYQGVLKNERVFGLPDLLEKTKGKSKLGSYTYRPVDVKSHAKVTKKDKLQLAAYAFMLESVLGEIPTQGVIILKDESWNEVNIEDEIQEIHQAMNTAEQVEKKKLKTLPLRCSECGTCGWSDYCTSERKEKKLVTLLSEIGAKLTKQLIQDDIVSYEKLAKLKPEKLVKKYSVKSKNAMDAIQNAKAWDKGKPIVKNKVSLPKEKQTIIHYDIETFEGSLYLHGLIVQKGSKTELKQFVAKSLKEEEAILKEFLDFVAQYTDPIIYTWSTFENRTLEILAAKYPKHKKDIKKVLDQFVDLKDVVKDALYLPVTTFSIKDVGPVFGFHWRAEDAGGSNSEAWYGEWLQKGDQELFQKIMHYNEDDVQAMYVIYKELRKWIA